jgi:hypothetical protein
MAKAQLIQHILSCGAVATLDAVMGQISSGGHLPRTQLILSCVLEVVTTALEAAAGPNQRRWRRR